MNYDSENLKKQAIVDFSTRRRTNTSKAGPQKSEDQLAMKAKIEEAKIHAMEELKAFRAIIEEAKSKTSDLVLFKDAVDILENIFIRTILEEITEPVIKGKEIPYMDPTVYKEMRKMMYRDLIQNYCKDR